ncbi:hypothetical protein BH09VER1_BH09VER1_28670 [soil metagenome]
MNTSLQLVPPPSDDFFSGLPHAARVEVRAWSHAFRSVPLVKPIGVALRKIANILGTSPKTVEAKYLALKKGADWRVFVDHRLLSPSRASRVKDPRFQAFIKNLFEKHRRVSASAIDELYKMWRDKAAIPAYEGHPGWPNIPEGWSERNLYRQQPSKTELTAFRIGLTRASGDMPQVFTTRVGLWCMSHVMIDDLWHDNFVRVGERGKVGRVLELDALDVHSGYKVAWGFKPRLPKILQPSVMEGLTEKNTRLLLAATFFRTGYSPRGTKILAEHGTAAVSDRAARILYDSSNKLIQLRESGITGAEQVILGSWKGQGKGNPKFKAPLESLRNLIHNRLDALPGQAGPNRDDRPEITNSMLQYQQDLLELAAKLPPARQSLLVHPLWDFHSQFCPFVSDLYREMNERDNHRLEGWSELGFITHQYRLAPQSSDWLTEENLLALPPASRQLLNDLVRAEPDLYSRNRRLSPADVFHRGSDELLTIGPEVVGELLIDDYGREEKVKGAYFEFDDIEISPELLRFEARIYTPGGTRPQELPSGEKYMVFVNPILPEFLFVFDSRKAFLGLAQRVQKVTRLDETAGLAAMGLKKHRTAERLQPMRMRHEDERLAHASMVENNERVANESIPVTVEEKATDRRIRREKGSIADLTPEDAPDPADLIVIADEVTEPGGEPITGSLRDLF